MVNRKSLLRGLAAVCAVAGVGVFAGCGGVSPGEYVFYRVAGTEAVESAGCYGTPEVPPNHASDSSTIYGSGTFILYAGTDTNIYLDTGKDTLQGAETDSGYSFAGKSVNVEFTPEDGSGIKETTTVAVTITLNVDGKTVTGSSVKKTSYKCSGNGCPDPKPTCTETTNFIGTEVDDVDLKHDV